MTSLLEKDGKGFRLFPKAVTSITGRTHADLVPDILRSTTLVSAVKYCTRNTLDSDTYTRDLIPLEKVWFPFMSALLALVPLEIEFVLRDGKAETMRYMPISTNWKDESPIGPLKAVFVQPATERVKLAVGDVVVYWSTMVYRVVTPKALHVLVPGAISDSAQKDNLLKIAHVPFNAKWSPSLAQTLLTYFGYTRRVSSRYVAEQTMTEKQATDFAKTINLPIIAPEYPYARASADERKQSVVLNRYDWIDPKNATSYVSLQPPQVEQYEYAFLTRPYRFFLLSWIGWVLVLIGLGMWLYRRFFGAPSPPPIAYRSRSSSRKPTGKPTGKPKPKSPGRHSDKKTPASPKRRRRRQPKPVFVPVQFINVPSEAPGVIAQPPPPVPAVSSPARRRRKSPQRSQVLIQIRK